MFLDICEISACLKEWPRLVCQINAYKLFIWKIAFRDNYLSQRHFNFRLIGCCTLVGKNLIEILLGEVYS